MTKYHKKNTILRRRVGKIFGAISLGIGIIVTIYFFFPLISYQLFLANAVASGGVESPLPKDLSTSSTTLPSLLTQSVNSVTYDYTDARNWYPQIESNKETKTLVDTYHLTIPKLNIENAIVSTNNYDLSQTLVQYYGEGSPPNKGTSVIYGHSSLPQLFNPSNYKTIFATVHNLNLGDELITTVNGKSYQYKIFSINITEPEDVNIFSQSYDNSYITLVTCTPPGTIWKRLILRASLVKEVTPV